MLDIFETLLSKTAGNPPLQVGACLLIVLLAAVPFFGKEGQFYIKTFVIIGCLPFIGIKMAMGAGANQIAVTWLTYAWLIIAVARIINAYRRATEYAIDTPASPDDGHAQASRS